MTWTKARETADEWIERIGLCYHTPVHADGEVCREQRRLDRLARQKLAPRPTTPSQRAQGIAPPKEKLW